MLNIFSRRLLYSVFLLFSLCTWSVAGQVNESCTDGAWPSDCSDLQPDPDLQREVLANGLRLVFKKNSEPAHRLGLYLVVRAGSLHERPYERGVAHFLEHMMFNGTSKYPPGKLVPHLQRMGIDFGRDSNAYTGYDSTVYHLILPAADVETVRAGMEILADFIHGASLGPQEIEQERKVILAERRSRDSLEYRNHIDLTKTSYAGTRLAGHEIIGSRTVLETADRKLLVDFYNRWYRPDNIDLVMVGDADAKLVLELAEEIFSTIPRPVQPLASMVDFGRLQERNLSVHYQQEPELGRTEIRLEGYWSRPLEFDSLELEKRELLHYMVPMVLGYRLQRMEESEDFVCTESSAGYGDLLKRVWYFSITGESDPDHWQQCLTQLEQLRRQAVNFGVAEEEVQRVKKELKALLEERVASKQSMDSRSLANRIIRHLLNNRVFQSPEQELELYGPFVDNLKKADLTRVIQEILQKGNRLVSVWGNTALGEQGEEVVRSVYLESQKDEIGRPDTGKTVRFPYLARLPIPPEGVKPVQTTLTKSGITVYRFPNNLVLNLKKTDFEPGRFRFAAHFGSGRLQAKPSAISLLAEEVVGGSGTGRYSGSEIEQILAGRSINMVFTIGETSFSWSGGGLTKDFVFGMELLQSVLRDPGIREVAFERARTGLEQIYSNLAHKADGAIPLKVQPFLAGNDERFGLPPWETVEAVTFEELRSWVASQLRPIDLELSIVGDVDVATVLQEVEQTFARLKLEKPRRAMDRAVLFPKGKELRIPVASDLEKGLAVLCWGTEDFRDVSRNRRIYLVGMVLEDRLRKVLRERLGTTYSPAVSQYFSRGYADYGYLMSLATVAREQVERTVGVMEEVGRDLVDHGISAEELDKVRRPLLSQLHEILRNNGYWLHSVLALSSRYPKQLQWPESLLEEYGTIGTDEVSEAAKQYLKHPARVLVVPKTDLDGQHPSAVAARAAQEKRG